MSATLAETPLPDDHAHHDDVGFVRKYLWTYDHKMIGIQYLWTALFFLFSGGGLALLRCIEAVERDISPVLARHSNEFYLNAPLFRRIDDLYARRDTLNLNPEQARVLERYHTRFVRAGAALD